MKLKNKPMRKITNFDDCLNYVNGFGFAGRGSISTMQSSLCDACDLLLKASGQSTWYHKEFQPFYVRMRKYYAPNTKNYFPWRNRAVVFNYDASVAAVADFRRQRTHLYLPETKVTLCSGSGKVNDPYHECYVCKPSDL
jgi:hypothetical protein